MANDDRLTEYARRIPVDQRVTKRKTEKHALQEETETRRETPKRKQRKDRRHRREACREKGSGIQTGREAHTERRYQK